MTNQQSFKDNGYCVVPSVISHELRDFVTQYALFDEMQDFNPGDSQTPGAHFKYADPATETLLLQFQKIVENNTGMSLYPTYSYFRVYRNGDDLKKHKDRVSCQISATVCFNYSYDSSKYQWPIVINGEEIILSPGDMMIYLGNELTHWRDKFTYDEDAWQVQGFFHYVDINGPYADYKYDGRDSIGEFKKKSMLPISNKSYIQFTK
jgi:hypothetical protein